MINKKEKTDQQNMEEYTEFMKDLMDQPDTEARRSIEQNTEEKLYHDFASPLATPKSQLLKDLQEAGYGTKSYMWRL